MQDEHSDGAQVENPEAQKLEVEKWEFALSVLKAAVVSAGIKDIDAAAERLVT